MLKLKRYLTFKWIAIFTSVAIGVFLLPRSCNKNNEDQSAIVDVINDAHEQDSIKALEINNALRDTIEFIKGQIDLKENQVQAGQIKLDSLSSLVAALTKKHKQIKPAADTNVTIVPNEYINDCENCFTTITAYDQRAKATTAEYNELNELYINQAAQYDNQIKELQKQSDICNKQFNYLKGLTIKQWAELKPTIKIKLGGGAMSINSILPNAVGPGVMYEDKHGTDYIGKFYISKYGTIYALDIYKTISFRKRRK